MSQSIGKTFSDFQLRAFTTRKFFLYQTLSALKRFLNLHVSPESLPPKPDPGRDFAKILAWLMKLNGTAKLSKCKMKWEKHLEQEIPVEEFIERLEQRDYLIVIIPRKGGRIQKKYIMLTEKGWTWAAKWTHYYDVDIPHHRHFKKLKK